MKQAETTDWEIFDASSYKVGIVVSQFNRAITDQLLSSALETLKQYAVPANNTKIVKVAGSIEIPLLLQKLAATKKYNCLVALGAVIRGETAHFDYVCKFVTEGILKVQLENSLPIGFGILTTDNQQQAKARTNLGGGYAEAALQSAQAIKSL